MSQYNSSDDVSHLDVLDDERLDRLCELEVKCQILKGLFDADGDKFVTREMRVGEPLSQTWSEVADERADLQREIINDVRKARETAGDRR